MLDMAASSERVVVEAIEGFAVEETVGEGTPGVDALVKNSNLASAYDVMVGRILQRGQSLWDEVGIWERSGMSFGGVIIWDILFGWKVDNSSL